MDFSRFIASALTIPAPSRIRKRAVLFAHILYLHINNMNGSIDASIIISLNKEKRFIEGEVGHCIYLEYLKEISKKLNKQKLKVCKRYEILEEFHKMKGVVEDGCIKRAALKDRMGERVKN